MVNFLVIIVNTLIIGLVSYVSIKAQISLLQIFALVLGVIFVTEVEQIKDITNLTSITLISVVILIGLLLLGYVKC